ncbi:3-oxosteroid 1-dehydrogenase [Variovorax sp. SRS16]|uniref:FAD-dependent oxidoreductase n=1 Tax=Variovorax sp. SRS16 TaxID=282217 RepID=UPI0013189647|nr:FAD-dependent oxidoreductase [Variovorax sp. SRS16]VTU20606.1 3-oxosteroid 1-dehydrogenase [Variovorax sp. SRS16]
MRPTRDADGRSETFDLVVVGGGAGGMTAALVAALEGLRVVLCEGSEQLGGTTATSAGTLWIPGNRQGRDAGHADSIEAAQRYLENLAGPDDERGCRRAFLETGDAAIAYLEARTDVAFVSAGLHPDYLVRPGAATTGRALAPRPFDGRLLGERFDRVRPPIPEFLLLGGMMVGKADIQALLQRWRSWPHFLQSARLVARYAFDRLRYRRGTRLVMGNALVARLYTSLIKAGVDVRFGWALKEVDTHGGRVVGASFGVTGGVARLACTRGVVLATGGIGHSESLRREFAPQGPAFATLACASVAGDGIAAARRAGAGIERHAAGDFFWQPVSRVPRKGAGEGLFPHLFLDRAKPGLAAVDARGERFVNEASSYHHFVAGLRQREILIGQRGAWLVCDAAFVRRYGLGVIAPGTKNLRAWDRRGYVMVADSLLALATRAGIDPEGLSRTVERHNADAVAGNDAEFGKGIAPLDRFNGDSSHRPNPCLGPISKPPFIALRIDAADAASSAGLATDRDGRVMSQDGDIVQGLYACGNDAASVMRGTYPGPGTTLGPAVVFGYRVAMHARSQLTSQAG